MEGEAQPPDPQDRQCGTDGFLPRFFSVTDLLLPFAQRSLDCKQSKVKFVSVSPFMTPNYKVSLSVKLPTSNIKSLLCQHFPIIQLKNLSGAIYLAVSRFADYASENGHFNFLDVFAAIFLCQYLMTVWLPWRSTHLSLWSREWSKVKVDAKR